MPASRVVGVVCDLDGVVRHFDTRVGARLEAEYGLEPGVIAAHAFSPALIVPAVTGVVSDEQWRNSIAAGLEQTLPSETARLVVADWSALPGQIDHDVLSVLRLVRESAPVVVLTNATTRLFDDLGALEVLDAFDGIVSSAVTGIPKPEPGAYRAAQEAVEQLLGRRVEPAELLFIDDDVRHVRAAGELGWNTIHFAGVTSLVGALQELGLLPSGRGSREGRSE